MAAFATIPDCSTPGMAGACVVSHFQQVTLQCTTAFPILGDSMPIGVRHGHIAPPQRARALADLHSETFDVVVVGGGIAGACAAWDATLRGLRVALVEKSDFGSGASAHSLKVLHGGIRYLQHLDLSRLQESCHERGAFLAMAPHLTRPMPFALPTYGHGLQGKLPLRAAFLLLELLTSGRNRGIANAAQHVPAPFLLSRREFLDRFPAFDDPRLTGAGVFYDGQIVNPPRLVYSIVRTAHAAGATVANYCEAEQLQLEHGRVTGLLVRDTVGGERFAVRTRMVLNLAGPFAPAMFRESLPQPLDIPVSRDMAFVLRRALLPDMGLGVQTQYRDPDAVFSRGNRHIFMVPWRRYTLVGVHSRVFTDPAVDLSVTEPEIAGFLGEIQTAAPALNIRREDISVVNAGLLPIGQNVAGQKSLSLGKRSPLIDHEQQGGPAGLVTGMSVRWTMGRLTAERAVDLVAAKLGAQRTPPGTDRLSVHGGDIPDTARLIAAVRAASPTLPDAAARSLVATFGSGAPGEAPAAADLLPDGATLATTVRTILRDELVVTLADLVLRRLDLGSGEEPSRELLEACATIAAQELGWDAGRQRAELERVARSFPFASPASQQA